MTTKRGKLEAEDLVETFLKIQEDGDLEFPLTENNVKAVILVSTFNFCSITISFNPKNLIHYQKS